MKYMVGYEKLQKNFKKLADVDKLSHAYLFSVKLAKKNLFFLYHLPII